MAVGERPRGYVLRAHTADVIVEAWAPTRDACLEEAVHGLIATFALVPAGAPTCDVEVELTGGDVDLLLAALDEVIYRLDADDAIPAAVHVRSLPAGATLTLSLVSRGRAEAVGAAPKGVSWSGLRFGPRDGGEWRCQATIDV